MFFHEHTETRYGEKKNSDSSLQAMENKQDDQKMSGWMEDKLRGVNILSKQVHQSLHLEF
ncbi:hypothetical protein [Akkermansia sp.]|uniref:hypothetical protein n=1 Tax=Akkermansia sp. TaxID=1872421 RepID=UPI0025BBAF71|nr:hypothetical protein [Akkermansia sp.]